MQLRSFLAGLICFAVSTVAFAQTASRLPAPSLPPGTYAHWHSGKVLQKGGELTLVDLVGASHIVTAQPAFTIDPAGGIVANGSQSEGVRLQGKQPIANRFVMGADIRFDPDGPDHQTVAYLYRFAEFRYRKSRGELSFNVWQTSPEESGKEIVTSVSLPLPPEKLARVRGTIENNLVRLEIDGAKSDAKLLGSWEMLPLNTVFILAKGGSDRAFKGRLDHLFLAITP